MQVVLVYLEYISAKIHSKCASQPKIAKHSLKTHISGVQGRSRSSMLLPPESSSAVLLTVAEIAHFQGGTQIWCRHTENPFNLKGQSLHC